MTDTKREKRTFKYRGKKEHKHKGREIENESTLQLRTMRKSHNKLKEDRKRKESQKENQSEKEKEDNKNKKRKKISSQGSVFIDPEEWQVLKEKITDAASVVDSDDDDYICNIPIKKEPSISTVTETPLQRHSNEEADDVPEMDDDSWYFLGIHICRTLIKEQAPDSTIESQLSDAMSDLSVILK